MMPLWMHESSLRWCRKMPVNRPLGPDRWMLPLVLQYATRVAYGVGFAALGLVGCAPRSALVPDQIELPNRPKIAVMPFNSSNPYIPGTSISDCFVVNILRNLPQVQIIERKDLAKVLEEQKLSLSGIVQSGKYGALGMFLGVDALLMGSVETLEAIQSVKGSIAVTVKLVEVSTGKILWADRSNISHSTWSVREIEEVSAALLEKAAKSMVRKMGKEGIAARFSREPWKESPAAIKEAKRDGSM